ncbi:MAG: hypothetical protein ABJA69_07905 [Acidobacteriaceae bacterium]
MAGMIQDGKNVDYRGMIDESRKSADKKERPALEARAARWTG